MSTTTIISDDDLAVVARVAAREGWSDLSAPPEQHGPRSIEEGLAVARFTSAVPRGPSPRAAQIRARLAIVAVGAGVLGACWWVSPTRTAIGLFGAGIFSLVAMRRRSRRASAPSPPRRGLLLGGLRTR